MKNKIDIVFSKNNNSFRDFIKIKFKDYGVPQLSCTLPIEVYNIVSGNRTLLFKTSFMFNLPDIETLTLMSIHSYSVHKFFEKFFLNNDLLLNLQNKAELHLSDNIIEPIAIDKSNSNETTEFIAVDDDTDFYGNYILDDNEGCYLNYGKNGNYPISELINYTPILSLYKLPYRFRKDNVQFDNEFYKLTVLQKICLIEDNLTVDEIVKLYQDTLIEDASSMVQYYYPYQVRLSGNDDDSWTKYFTTEESMMNEVYRLRRTQPINKELDVQGCGYIFTN